MTTAMQIGETARDRADFRRCFKTGAALFLHDDGIVAHSAYKNTLRAACMLARTTTRAAATPKALLKDKTKGWHLVFRTKPAHSSSRSSQGCAEAATYGQTVDGIANVSNDGSPRG